ncbi:alpha/beta fold hydrolase [Streptomyces sp. NPDC058249]|uniref:alpha/beta fold hydrolase n=1 Tax=Streptomyces sp. NPDC058249 TaxID=3346403 RepID=UPI0036E5D0AA
MQQAQFDGKGSHIRWTEAAGAEPSRVYVHGLGSASTVYNAHIAARPELAGRRTLFVDLPGHGISDRPADFGYTLEDHAEALAVALDTAHVTGAELVAHSMGGAVAIVLAHRRPDLVSRLVLAEANLDPHPPVTAGSSGIASYDEEDYVVSGGHARVLEKVGPFWAATMRLADPRALHRTAKGLRRGTSPTMRRMLEELTAERVYLQGELSGELPGREDLEAAGVRVVTVPGAGHNVMFDNPDAFAAEVAGRAEASATRRKERTASAAGGAEVLRRQW